MISIIGLGPGSYESLTLGALHRLKNAKHIVLRTMKHPTVSYLSKEGIDFETCDRFYDNGNSFEEVYKSIVEYILKLSDKYNDLVYAVPGHPLVAESSVTSLIAMLKQKSIPYEIISAVSFIDVVMESIEIDPIKGFKLIDAFDINNYALDKRVGVLVTQVYDKLIASEVKLTLGKYYGDEFVIKYIHGAGIKEIENIKEIPIYEIDRQKDIDYLTSLYIPPCNTTRYDFNDLISIMKRLRDENGCPWDREQDHSSLKKYLIEESYEVLEAIDEKNQEMIIEELGDVLLQVVFHSQIGEEDEEFDISDVTDGICRKMIERHPHVFGDVLVKDSEEVLENWEEIKKKEQGLLSYTDTMKHVPKCLPALMRAEKVQNKAKKVGFEWDTVEEAFEKVEEELVEVKNVYKGNNRARILEELGDLLFSVTNVARFLGIDSENAINSTTDKFIKRFQYIEETSLKNGRDLTEMTLCEMDSLWNQAKSNINL